MGRFAEVRIGSLGELMDQLTPRAAEDASGRRRAYAVYRGVTDTSWSLLTSLDRLGGTERPHGKAHLEEHILRNFMRYALPYVGPAKVNEWELLVTAQHHGLPTRLLDWTFSPLVAAHFATLREERGGDRVVWRLDWRVMHDHFQLKPLAFLVSDLDEALRQKGFNSVWDLFNARADDARLFVCMLEPPAIDARLASQSAAFTLSSSKTRGLDAILQQCGLTHCLTKFIIPAERVAFVRDQLDMCGVDERKIFPDLDGVAEEIARYYAVGGIGGKELS